MAVSHLGKWGRSYAVRVPRALVERCGLKEGDPIDMDALESAILAAQAGAAKERREAALQEIRKGRINLPADWKFDREEANWRPAMDRW
jgi:antitoxin MazE